MVDYRGKAVERAIVIAQGDTAQNIIGGGAGIIGGSYGIYEYMRSNKLNQAWDNIISDWESMKATLDDYVTSVNELIVIYDNAYVNGVVPDEGLVSNLMGHISDLELYFKGLYDDLVNQINAGKSAVPSNLFEMLWSWIEGMCSTLYTNFYQIKYATGMYVGYLVFRRVTGVSITSAGRGIYKSWEKLRDWFNDRNHPGGPSATCDLCGEDITAPNTEYLGMEIERHIYMRHVVNIPVAVAAVPSLVAILSQLPEWVQKSLALEVGVSPEYITSAPKLANSFQTDWHTIVGMVGILILTGVAAYEVAPWLGRMGQAVNVLKPAFALAPA